MQEILIATLGQYLPQIPLFLVWLVGIALAVVFWRRHPRVSLLAIIALALFLLGALVGAPVSLWLPMMMQERGLSPSRIGLMLTGVAVAQSLLSAVLWGIVIAAIFGWRNGRGQAGNT